MERKVTQRANQWRNLVGKYSYPLALVIFLVGVLGARFIYLDTHPYGFSGHAIVHGVVRKTLYDLIFIQPLTVGSLERMYRIFIDDQHGPQSLMEALLTPFFGFGFIESRLMISTLGIAALVAVIIFASRGVNKWFGLSLGLSFGIAPYFLVFSRYGDSEHVNIYLHGFLLLLAAQRVVSSNRLLNFIPLGIISGLSLYVYATNQFLCLVVLLALTLVSVVRFYDTRSLELKQRASNFIIFSLFTGLVAWPAISHYLAVGRVLPIRAPIGSPNYEFTDSDNIASQIYKLWWDLFRRGGDPWYARSTGCLNDLSLLLLIPGIISLTLLCRNALLDYRSLKLAHPMSELKNERLLFYNITFLCIVTSLFILLGGIPAILSPEPVFRRAMVLVIGLDIIKGAGIYGVVRWFQKGIRPKLVATFASLVFSVGYFGYQYQIFYRGVGTFETNSGNAGATMAALVRERLNQGLASHLLINTSQEMRLDMQKFIEFNLGFPGRLPELVEINSIEDLSQGRVKEVMVPFPVLEQIRAGKASLPEGVELRLINSYHNRGGETVSLMSVVEVPARMAFIY